jgi:hypothetical protein
MINASTTKYTPFNPSVTTYRYSASQQFLSNAVANFALGTYVTNTMRGFYGYSSSSLINAVELRLKSVDIEPGSGSAMNAQVVVGFSYTSTDFSPVGLLQTNNTFKVLSPLTRIVNGTAVKISLTEQASILLEVLTPGNYATSGMQFAIISASTGAVINTTDLVTLTFDVIEYVSKY